MVRSSAATCLLLLVAWPALSQAPPATIHPQAEEVALTALKMLGAADSDDEETLRQQWVNLASQRAATMTVEELRRAILNLDNHASLPSAAQEIMGTFRSQVLAIQRRANQQMETHKSQAIADLQEVQEKYTREGKLDEAIAVRDLIRSLKMPAIVPLPDPGTMSSYTNKVGRSYYFRVTGSTAGSIYGSGIYTYDSPLATAAVHAGALKQGETGIVRVTMLGPQSSYASTNKNGVQSNAYGAYSGSYRLESAQLGNEQPEGQAPVTND